MTRKEAFGSAILILGDSREVVAQLSYDAIVSDPPYGINHKVERTSITGRHGGNRAMARIQGDSEPFDPSPWIAKPAILWGANYYAPALPASGGWLVFDKRRGGTHNQEFIASDCELAWTNLFNRVRMFSHLWAGLCRESEVGQHHHPMQKPVALMEWCIGFLPPEASTIMDPYMGSGSTGVAAVKAGKKFIGIEIDARHFDVACRRMDAATRQGDMFSDRATEPLTAYHRPEGDHGR